VLHQAVLDRVAYLSDQINDRKNENGPLQANQVGIQNITSSVIRAVRQLPQLLPVVNAAEPTNHIKRG